MAQGAFAIMSFTNGVALTADDLCEISEYQKILHFHDSILAGSHAKIKVPHLAKENSSLRNVSSPLSTPHVLQPARSTSSIHYDEFSAYHNKSPINHRSVTSAYTPKASNAEINPILLEKSDDLIKAEIQLQRQRIERALGHQIEQQRQATKAALQTSESLPNFDLSEVLSKALSLVQPSTSAEAEPSVGARTSASDSFDENTFYSSQHDTPSQNSFVSLDERPGEMSAKSQIRDQDVVMTGTSLSHNNYLAPQPHLQPQPMSLEVQIPPPNNQSPKIGGMESAKPLDTVARDVSNTSSQPSQSKVPGPVSTLQRSSESSCMSFRQLADQATVRKTTDQILKQTFPRPQSPLIRAHNLSPIAPQPSRVSPLATARNPPVVRERVSEDGAQPAQVSALRNQPFGISSADSSPKGGKGSEKKKEKKKKKRKDSSKENVDTPDSPYIKPEPQSPSPFGVAPLPRPQKRQHYSGQYAAELNYDEPRYEPVVEIQERVAERYKEVRPPPIYEGFNNRYQEIRRPQPAYQRLERDEGEYRRVSTGHYATRPQSPAVYAYEPSVARPVRAVSRAIVERRPEPIYYRDGPRASVRPDANRERSRSPIMGERRSPIPMGPPRQPIRIVVDEYGREYIDPNPPSTMRQSVAPPVRQREDVYYERAPTRAASGRVPVEAYEEDGVLYRKPSPAFVAPRRVVTQPDYAPEYRSYRQREYSVRPTAMAPPDEEYVQIRGAPERRQMSHFEEAPREYLSRGPPAPNRTEPVRYEIPREYVGRLQSVRPEAPQEFAASVRPEARREVIPQSQREYSVRPIEPTPRREYMAAPEDGRYYEAERRPAEIAFIERPREASVFVYADNNRREVYR
ncbi:hypothetical protein B7494_g658 [Chlorociboria aeruginascens]|nr:hypothetical protein B7494_g658 [Chlorociboria aeruginascens]